MVNKFKKNNVFEVVRSSAPLEFEYVTYELLLNREPVLAVNVEKGISNLEVEVFGKYRGHGTGIMVPLDDLIESLTNIRDELEQLHKKINS